MKFVGGGSYEDAKKRVKIQAILAKVRSLKSLAESTLEDVKSSELGTFKAKRVKNLVDRYTEIRNWALGYFHEIGEHLPQIDSSIFYIKTPYRKTNELRYSISTEDAEVILQNIIMGCEVAEQGLQALLRPSVEPSVLDKLNSLRSELEKLEERGLDQSIVKNLREAIAEAEQGHYLASAMVSSRVISYIVDKISGSKDEDKVKYLVKRGVVPKDRKDVQKQILTSMRLSRNFLSHRVDLFPDASEVLMLLGGAFNLARLKLSIREL